MQTSTRASLTEHVPVPSANTNIQRRQAGKYCLFSRVLWGFMRMKRLLLALSFTLNSVSRRVLDRYLLYGSF